MKGENGGRSRPNDMEFRGIASIYVQRTPHTIVAGFHGVSRRRILISFFSEILSKLYYDRRAYKLIFS